MRKSATHSLNSYPINKIITPVILLTRIFNLTSVTHPRSHTCVCAGIIQDIPILASDLTEIGAKLASSVFLLYTFKNWHAA
jgi:hypothetical protein